MATIDDVAKECGVSKTTVSVVLNNGPRPVSKATRARVLDTMRRLNYQPHAAARGLALRRMNQIGVLFNDVEAMLVTNTYAAGILGGILQETSEREFNVLLLTQSGKVNAANAALRDRRADGVIVVAPPVDSPIIGEIRDSRMPFVVVAGAAVLSPEKTLPYPCVEVDNAAGARMATEHLIQLGHRRIAHITGTPVQASAILRRQAFLQTMADAGLPVPEEYVQEATFMAVLDGPAEEAARRLLSLPEPPTAIFAASDSIALTVLRVAKEQNISVPERLSVVGFDDIPGADQVTPALTTIRQPLALIGREATRCLLAIVNGEDNPSRVQLIDPTLIVRDSTAIAPVSVPLFVN